MNQYFQWFGLPGPFVLTCLMSLMAVILAAVFPSQHRWICAAAMIVSSLGDIVLMNFKGIGHRMPVPYFYVGAVLFMAAHLLYIRAFSLRIVRDGIIIGDDKMISLKRFKDDQKEVAQGYECGIGLEKFTDIQEGDIYETYIIEEYRD